MRSGLDSHSIWIRAGSVPARYWAKALPGPGYQCLGAMLDILGVLREVSLDFPRAVEADEILDLTVLGGDEGHRQGPVAGPPYLGCERHEPDTGAVKIFVPGGGELLGVGCAERAECLLAALEDGRCAYRGELGGALDQPVAMRMLASSSVGSAISRGETRASAALPRSSRAADAHSACSSKDRPGSGSMARLRNTCAFDHRASWSYGAITLLP